MGLIRTIADIYDSSQRRQIARDQLAEEMAGRKHREEQTEQAGARAGLQLDINQQEMDLRAAEFRRKLAAGERMAPLEEEYKTARADLAKAMAGKARSVVGPVGLNEKGLVQREAAIRRQLASPYTPEEDRVGLQGELDSIGSRLNKLQGVQAPPAVAPVTEPSAWERFSKAASGAIGSAIIPIRGAAQLAGQASGAAPAAVTEAPRIAAAMSGRQNREGEVSKSGKYVYRNGEWVKK